MSRKKFLQSPDTRLQETIGKTIGGSVPDILSSTGWQVCSFVFQYKSIGKWHSGR